MKIYFDIFFFYFQATATALYCTGFAESLSNVIGWHNDWAIRTIALITLLIILVIAICGVKWVIRFQLLLIVILAVAVLDFVIGTLVHTRPGEFVLFSCIAINANSSVDALNSCRIGQV